MSDEAYTALARKHPKAAIVKEVTVPDEEVQEILRAIDAKRSPYYRRHYQKKGLSCDAEIPEDFDMKNAKAVRRIDYLMFEGETITAIELKVSRADFKRDTEEKRRKWKSITHRFVYLTPKGLLKPEEIPEGCGLWEYDELGRVTVVKKTKKNPTPDPFPASMFKYFAWRVFLAEQTNPRRGRGRRTRR